MRPKPAKIVIYEGGPRSPWWAQVFDSAGYLRSGVRGYATTKAHHEWSHGHTEREYVEQWAETYFPGLPVEYRPPKPVSPLIG